LRHDGLWDENIEGRMRGKSTRGRRRIQMYIIWQMMTVTLHPNEQQRAEEWRHRGRMSKT